MIESINEIDFNAITLVHAIFFAIIGILFILTGKVLLICFGIILVAFGLLFPFYWLMTVIKQRHLQIQRALPNVLDILTLSVEAGRDFLTRLTGHHKIPQKRSVE